MSRFMIHSVTFDDDGVISVTYMDKEDALRKGGSVFRSQTVSVTPESGPLYETLDDVRDDVTSLLYDVTSLYSSTPAFIPEDQDEEDEEERGMGW